MSTSTQGKRARRVTVTIVVLAALAAAGFTVTRPRGEAQAQAAEPPVTSPVERTSLVSELRLAGSLDYGDPEPLPATEGIVTALPVVGAVIEIGDAVFEADGAPVPLFAGERPFWRELSTASSRGADILQLEENLHALGYLRRTPGDRFDWRTRQAVRDFQRLRGVEQTGVFAPGDVIVTDQAPLRIHQVTARLGQSGVSPATVTGAHLEVTATLTEAQARELVPGTPVVIELRDLTQIPGTIIEVDPGGQPAGDDGSLTSPSAVFTADDPAALYGATPGPVRIIVRDATETPATLVVPANALLATPDGGYAVEVWDGTAIRRVDVLTGAVADARVQVIGGDLAVGDLVVLAR